MKNERLYYLCSSLYAKLFSIFKKPLSTDYKKILFIKNDEIGDFVTALPSLKAIKDLYPNAKIDVCLKPYLHEFLRSQHLADEIFSQDQIAGRNYELVLDMRGEWNLLKYFFYQKPSFYLSRGTVRIKNKSKRRQHKHEVITNLEILEPLGVKAEVIPEYEMKYSNRSQQKAQLFLQRHAIDKFVLFHTAASKRLKQWHPKKFAELAQELKAKFDLDVIFAGTDADSSDIQTIQDKIPFQTYSFAGEGDLSDYSALVSKAALMVGNDSGPMHVAAATGVAVIGLFGPSEPHLFAPFGSKTDFIHHRLECNPCDHLNCVRPDDPCINLISVEEVLNKSIAFLKKS